MHIDIFDLGQAPTDENDDISKSFDLDPDSSENQTEYPPIATPEQEQAIRNLYQNHPKMKSYSNIAYFEGEGKSDGFDDSIPWIQTYSGRRFTPTAPNYKAIVLQDIAHALSMQCRFSGHCKSFYSVAQHSVLVSYICDHQDARWGLLHDASEAYLVDVPRPLKQSGKFGSYITLEKQMQEVICKRFELPMMEPPSVKRADTQLLVTEARDLMAPLHPDWENSVEPLPFHIQAWTPQYAKDMFIRRFAEIINQPKLYQYYLEHKSIL